MNLKTLKINSILLFSSLIVQILFFLKCTSMDTKENFQSIEGWNYSPELIQNGNSESIKVKSFFYKNFTTIASQKFNSKDQLEKFCMDVAKKEKSDDLIFEMVNEVTQPNPVIKHKQMTGALLVVKLTEKTSQVKVLECAPNLDKNNCACVLTIEIDGGRETILNLAKEIDNKPIGKK